MTINESTLHNKKINEIEINRVYIRKMNFYFPKKSSNVNHIKTKALVAEDYCFKI